MARANFEAVMAEIFKHEGGYVDHPKDPGGATNMGITFAVLQDWRGGPITKADVKALSKDEARAIYLKNYWTPTKCDDLPAGLDLVMMDGSVNSGIGRGPKWVQAAIGVPQDGKVGPQTIAAANSYPLYEAVNRACDARLGFLKSLKTWPTFGKGWERRVADVRKRALDMAKAPVQTQEPVRPTTEPPKANIPTQPLPPAPPSKPSLVPWIIGAAVLAGVAFFLVNAQVF